MFGLKIELMACTDFVGGTTEQICIFLILYDSINDMKQLRNVFITPQLCHIHFCCLLLPICPKLDIWAEMKLMVCADLVGGTTEQSCLFTDLI